MKVIRVIRRYATKSDNKNLCHLCNLWLGHHSWSLERTVAGAAGGGQCCDERCERGYYHLHRNLDNLRFLHGLFNFSILKFGPFLKFCTAKLMLFSVPLSVVGLPWATLGGEGRRYQTNA